MLAIGPSTPNASRIIAQSLLGVAALALLTWISFRLDVDAATAALLYLSLIVAASLWGTLVPALVLAIGSIACLDYFFTPPLFAFAFRGALDVVAVFVFSVIAVVITRLVTALRRSEQHWRDVFESNPTMYFMVASDGTVLSVNPHGAEQLGYTIDEIVGGSVLAVFHEDDKAAAREHVANCVAHIGRSTSWEIRKIRKDGTMLWVRETARAVKRAGDRPVVLIACEDITDRIESQEQLRRREAELRRSEAFLAEGQRLSRTGSFGWNASTGHLYWSDETYRIFECDRSSMLTAELVFERTHPDDWASLRETIERAQRDGSDIDAEHRLLMPDGSVKHLQVVARAERAESGAVEYVGAVMDITRHKRADYLISHVFETSPDGVAIVGVDYRFRRVNPVIERSGAMPEASFVGMHLAELLGPEVFERTIRPHLDRCFAGEEVRFEDWFFHGVGRHYVSVTYSPLRPDGARVEAALLITRDLTETILAAEALQRTQSDLARVARLTTMGELAASIAHELRQPLAAIAMSGTAALRWLNREPPMLEEARDAASRVVHEAHRADEVIRGLRGMVGKSTPEKGALDLNDAIHEVLELVHSEMRRQGVSVRTDLVAGLPPVLGDRVQLEQVLLNLIMNGVEAMSEVRDRPKAIVIRGQPSVPSGLVVTVEDAGPGLDPAIAERIFEPFFTTKPNGLGMGLSICRSIIDAHGGKFWASRGNPHGTAFHFSLPAIQDAREPLARA